MARAANRVKPARKPKRRATKTCPRRKRSKESSASSRKRLSEYIETRKKEVGKRSSRARAAIAPFSVSRLRPSAAKSRPAQKKQAAETPIPAAKPSTRKSRAATDTSAG